MTDRKIITWRQYLAVGGYTPEFEEIKRRDFNDLPDAPKHTDEEYEGLELINKGNYICAEKGKARIKELESEKARLEMRLDKYEID